LNKSRQNAPHFAVLSGSCSETEVSEQLYFGNFFKIEVAPKLQVWNSLN
jgi:hypothetical protein